jgi:RND superfamily putative drug exporter
MSSFLFRLGRRTAHRARTVVVAWVLLLVAVGAAAALGGGQLEDDLSIPGTEAQDGIDVLDTRFPELTGTTGQLVFQAPRGEEITSYREQVEARVDAVREVDRVEFVSDPFAEENRALSISADERHALVQVQLGIPLEDVDEELVEQIDAAATDVPSGPGDDASMDVHLGGQMFTTTSTPVSATEAVGLAVALVVLLVTLGSFLAAGIPLLTAVLGVGVTMAGLLVLASSVAINTSTPSLAMMIGLAVGIDYALFLVSRHRSQLAEGIPVEESVARAVATAGSAVIFAGATVIIALCGLVVARIPFLTVMGLAGAAAVAVAVAIAVTLVPAVLALAGDRLRPGRKSGILPRQGERNSGAPRRTPATAWVSFVTRRPAVTTLLVVAGLLALAVPAKDLALGLPDTGSAERGSSERVTYDLVSEEYGDGFNGPLLVVVDIIRTREPVQVMERIGKDLGETPGVEAIALTTPNRTADLGVVQVIPEKGQTDPATAQLVRDLRDRAEEIEQRYDVTDLMVTGQTAVTIDVSDRLADALLPFGLVVVGMSLLLLMIVFRSVAVPVKATLGYLLSVGASFGVVVLVFQQGWFAELVNVERQGPVLSFLPIILMGVLFGLAMDYEVFLVARMREDYVHRREAQAAIVRGFAASARVVLAAAVIMVAVFASFVPHGDSSVKPIALGLAVGVLVDAFVVRMTLVPAVLALLGDRAWWLPVWLDRRLPELDVEGEGLVAHLEHEEWVAEHGRAAVRIEGMRLDDAHGRPLVHALDLVVRPGEVVVLTGDATARRATLAALSGRLEGLRGTVVVLDRILPAESAAVRARVGVDVFVSEVREARDLTLLDLETLGHDDARHLVDLAAAGAAIVVAGTSEVAAVLDAAELPVTQVALSPDREDVLL